MNNPFLEARREKRTLKKHRHYKCKIISEEKGKGLLLFYINDFIKRRKKNSASYNFFDLVMNWFFSTDDITVIPFDFVFRTQLIGILQTELLQYKTLPSNTLINILRIISVLTAKDAPFHDFFSNSEMINIFCELLNSENHLIIKFVLIIISQILMKQPDLLQIFLNINITDMLLNKFLISDNLDVSGVSTFFLCQIAYLDRNQSISIINSLFNFVLNSNPGIILTLLKGIYFYSSVSSEFLSDVIQNDFPLLCSNFIMMIIQNNFLADIKNNSIFIDIICLIFSTLGIVIRQSDGISRFLSSNLLAIITKANMINPNIISSSGYTQLILLLCQLIVIDNNDIESQIYTNNIIEYICEISNTGDFDSKIQSLGFFCTVINKGNKNMCRIFIENNGLKSFFELFETFDENMAYSTLKTLIHLIDILPEAVSNIHQIDVDLFASKVDAYDNSELSDIMNLFLSKLE